MNIQGMIFLGVSISPSGLRQYEMILAYFIYFHCRSMRVGGQRETLLPVSYLVREREGERSLFCHSQKDRVPKSNQH